MTEQYNPYNPRKLATDREGILDIISDGRLDTVIITCMLNSQGRSALQKFLKFYVVERHGMEQWFTWMKNAELVLRRLSALKASMAVLTVPADQTTTTEEESMYVKFHYFDWWVEPKDKSIPIHPKDKHVQRRVIDKQIAEREANPTRVLTMERAHNNMMYNKIDPA